MAKGREKYEDYRKALSLLGKDLARRAKSKCELSGESGSLEIVDLHPDAHDPSMNSVLLVRPDIAKWLQTEMPIPESQARFLEHAIWSEVQPVRIATRRLLKRLDTGWANDALESLDGWAPEE